MAMFANAAGAYGLPKRQPWDTPGIGDGQLGAPSAEPTYEPGLGMFGNSAPAPARPKASLIGILGDALAGAAGQAGPYAAQVAQQRQRQQQLQDYAQKRGDDWRLWEAQQRWERANPKPVNNDTTADYDFITQRLGKAAADQWLRNKGDPVISVPVPGGTYVGPRSGLGGLGEGGDPTSGMSGGVGSPPPASSTGPDGPLSVDDFSRLRSGLGGDQQVRAWQAKHGKRVLVRNREEAMRLPSGTLIQSDDGRQGVVP